MSTPILQALQDDLVAALAAIDTDADYHTTLEADCIYRDPVNLMTVPKAPAVVIGPGDGSSRAFLASMRVREQVVFAIEGCIDATGLDPDRKVDAFAAIVADLERALTQDITRGGLAARTLLRPPVGPFMGFANQARVLFTQEIVIDLVRAYGAA